ncbi:hypothetical protein OEW28_14755 [Defluviimonas sp. WL0002]|uniref:Uncharacterized protein n=1 Tax=Albidovulum marisflavi TaxID=2984159 RepID=A0ABT2ZFQ4_9RHOB|nr:hypothetical protein [Defluviimonas sp. WL0002]MCV2869890.1 hypothetical protein [Defluviimonas sp. WL0002]
MQSQAYELSEKTNPGIGGSQRSDLVRVLLILALFAATGLGISVFADDPDHSARGRPEVIEDWHGIVARSTR